MINVAMLWFFLLPICLGAGLWYLLRKTEGSWIVAVAYVAISIAVIAGAFYGSRGATTSDIEILNGQVTGKTRDHGTYEESYECNCRNVTETYTETVYSTDSKGKTTSRQVTKTRTKKVCETCYRTHYTVKWDAQTTVGSYRIDSEDWTNRGVYALPDPQRYTITKIGEPAARRHSYTNYVQAVPDSLFHSVSPAEKAKFSTLLVPYPDNVFDHYRINRFVTPGFSVPDAAQWNLDIGNMLRTLGPQKQVNAIVVIAKTDNPNYEYALRDHWEGANKNDVVLLIGSNSWPTIDFVRVISWTKNEAFKIQLRDNMTELGTIERPVVMNLLQDQIAKNFERRHMKEFEYLEGQIDPPTWLLLTVFFLIWVGAGGAYFITTEKNPFAKRRYIR